MCALSIAFVYQGAKARVLTASWNNGTYSYLEGAKLQTRPKLSLSTIKKGTFQTQTEKWLTTKVPKRDSVILFNAKVQRGMIKVANMATGFDTIPTFYGSNVTFTESQGILASLSGKVTEKRITAMHDAAEAVNNFSEEHPQLSVTIALAGYIARSEASHTFELVSNPESSATRQENFGNRLNSNVNYIDLSCSNLEQYSEYYFKTDHHWNITGASEGYKAIMNAAYPELPQLRPYGCHE